MNVIHNFSLDRACKKIKSFSFRLHLVAFIAFLSVSGSMVQAATITSTADGDWNAPTTWAGGVVPLPTDNVIINNAIVFNVPISIAGTYTFNADCGGAGNLTLSSGGILDVKANVDFSGNGNTLTGGTIYVRTGYTLSAGSAVSQTGALIVIEPDGFFYVNGDYTNNGGSIQLDGELYVGGNYLGLNAASITGTGTFISTGTMTGTVGSTIFGQANSSCTDPSGCDGNALCGLSASASAPGTAVCSGSSASITSTISSGTPTLYQWQSSSYSNGGFTDIPGANSSTYSAAPASNTYYRVAITVSSCITKSTIASLVVNPLPAAPTSTTNATRDCSTGIATLTASGTPATFVWYTAPTGGVSIGGGSPFSTPTLTSTTIFYAATKIAATQCESATRTSATAFVTTCPVTWTGSSGTDWGTASNWSASFVPSSVDNVTIPFTTNKPTLSGAQSVQNLVINSGAILKFNSGSILTVYGNITNSGTVTMIAPGTGTKLSFAGSSAQTITGVTTLYALEINNAAGVSILSPLTLNGNLYLTKGILTTNNQLSINVVIAGGSIAYVPGDLGDINGKVTIARNIVAPNTHYFSVPLTNVDANDLADDAQVINPATNATRLFESKFSTQSWNAITDLSTVFDPIKGYSMFFLSASNVDFTGNYSHASSFTTGPISYSLPGEFVLVGNPYPSTLDWDKTSGWTKTNVNNAIYFWNPVTRAYASYVAGAGTNGGTKNIPIMNSFFVGTSGSSGTASVAINNAARTTTFASYWRTSPDEQLNITLTNGMYSDETVVRFNEEATTGFDGNLDAEKLGNLSSVPEIYTYERNVKYSVNSVADPADFPVIMLYTRIPSSGEYVLKVKNSTDKVYVIEDKKLGTTALMGDSIVFEGSKFDAINRFVLKLQGLTTSVDESNTSAIQVQSTPGGFLVRTQDFAGKLANIEILDITGRSLKILPAQVLENGYKTYTLDEFVSGTYLIKVGIEESVFMGQITLMK